MGSHSRVRTSGHRSQATLRHLQQHGHSLCFCGSHHHDSNRTPPHPVSRLNRGETHSLSLTLFNCEQLGIALVQPHYYYYITWHNSFLFNTRHLGVGSRRQTLLIRPSERRDGCFSSVLVSSHNSIHGAIISQFRRRMVAYDTQGTKKKGWLTWISRNGRSSGGAA